MTRRAGEAMGTQTNVGRRPEADSTDDIGRLSAAPVRRLIERVFDAWTEEGIEFLILRNYEDLPERIGNDLDVLVSPKRRADAEHVLIDTCRSEGWRLHHRAEFSPVSLFFHCPVDLRQVHVDLFSRLAWRGVPILFVEDVLGARIARGRFAVPAELDEAVISFLGHFLYNGCVREKYRSAIRQRFAAESAAGREVLARLFGRRNAEHIVDLLVVGDWDRLERRARASRRALLARRAVGHPGALVASQFAQLIRITRRALAPPGLSVALLGPDGSGKSTLARSIRLALAPTFYPDKGFLTHWKPPLRRGGSGEPVSDPHSEPPRGRLFSYVFLAAHMVEFIAGWWLKVRPALFVNGFVVFDRYYDDFRVDRRRYRLQVSDSLVKAAGRLVPRPDLTIGLDVPPDELRTRKTELEHDEAARQRRAYRDVVASLDGGVVVDASRPADEVAREVTRTCLTHLAARFESTAAPSTETPSQRTAIPEELGPRAPTGPAPGTRRTRVLLCAYACEPGRGSEPGVGWNVATHLARHEDVWVLTRANNRDPIERELGGSDGPGLRFEYYDLPRWLAWWKSGARGLRLYYYLWQLGAYARARALHRQVGFDVVRHVTFVKYSIPCFCSLLGVPFVWGPVGGGESAPRPFRADLGWRGRLYEWARDASRWLGEHDPFVRLTAARSELALATTEDTAARLRRLGATHVEVASEAGLAPEQIERLGSAAPTDRGPGFRVVSLGRLIHWKGVHLAIEAFAATTLEGGEYWIIGDGAERRRLEGLAHSLGVADRVRFFGQLSRRDALARLRESDVLIHPSLHDSGGWVCLEAMAAGKPVVCLDLGGPGTQVTDETGIRVSARDPSRTVHDLSRALVRLAEEPGLRRAMGDAGRARVAGIYRWDVKACEAHRDHERLMARPRGRVSA